MQPYRLVCGREDRGQAEDDAAVPARPHRPGGLDAVGQDGGPGARRCQAAGQKSRLRVLKSLLL